MITPSKAHLITCTISGFPATDLNLNVNFHIKEFRIYEDICKPYFTGELVIETHLNNYEKFLYPTVEVIIAFECPRSDAGPTRSYRERFRIFSYDTTSIGSGAHGRLEHKISLMGQEYYNDKHNVITQNFNDKTGTGIASSIHNKYMASNGGLRIDPPSLGMFGSQDKKYQIINKKPMKAIHDILDRCVYSQFKSCAPVYFRDRDGYVIAPLQQLLENASIDQKYLHYPAMGRTIQEHFSGYDRVIDFKPIAPAGETSQGVRASEISGMMKGSSFFDFNTKNIIHKLPKSQNFPNSQAAKQMLAEASRGGFGGFNMFHVIDELLQKRSVDKHGPGGYNTTQEAFLTALAYAPKFWVSVPGQTGLNITCGKRMIVTRPVNDTVSTRTLFVPRLVHEVRFTEGEDRRPVKVQARTEIYGVQWR